MEFSTIEEAISQKSFLTKNIVNNVYGAGAAMYDKIMAQGWRSLIDRQRVIDSLELKKGDHVLEVGVGTGLNVKLYSEQISFTAIDFTQEMLQIAIDKFPLRSHSFQLMDAESMTFDNNTFDSILTTLVISAAPNPEKLLSECYRVTKPGGKIALLDVCQSPLGEVANVQEQLILPYSTTTGFPAPNENIPGGVIVYQPNRNIVEMIQNVGWDLIEQQIINPENPFTCRIYLAAQKV